MTPHHLLRSFGLAAALLATASLWAQSAPTPGRPTNSTTVELDKFEVSSSKIDGLNNKSLFRTDEEAPLPFNVIDRGEIDRLGATSMEELFRNVPEATNYGNILQSAIGNVQVSGGQTYSTASVNLGGFGAQQTVVLINGRRLGPGSNVGGTDISRIPIGAIERIEVLSASAAALYGGGAVGGAVNVILRKDYAMRDVTTYFGTSTHGGGSEFRVTGLQGMSLNGGRTNVTFTLDYNTREPIYHHQRNYLQRALDKYGPNTPYRTTAGISYFESVALRALAGMPGNILINAPTGGLNIPGNPTARYAAIPAGLNAAQSVALTPASFTATAGKPNLEPRYNRSVLYRPQTNYSLQSQAEHTIIKDKLTLYLEAQVAYQRQNYSFPQSLSHSMTATDPYNPFRTGVTPGFVGIPIIVLFDTPDIRDPSSFQEREDGRLTIGLKGKLSEKWEWTFDASGQYQRLFSDAHNPPNNLSTFLTRPGPNDPGAATAVRAPSSLAERWGIYSVFADHDLYPISAATETSLFIYDRHNSFYNRNAQTTFRAVGEILQLPAGPWRISPGGEIRWDRQRTAQYIPIGAGMNQLTGLTTLQPSYTPSSETVQSVYFESTVPVIGRRWRPLPAQSAEIGFSRRWDVSNHVRNTISNTVSGMVTIVPDISLRASLSEGFVPLTSAAIVPPTTATNQNLTITDPRRGNVATLTQVPTYITGGNPLLRTEFSRSKNFGVILKPRFLNGLSITVDYREIVRIDTPSAPALADVLNFPQDYEGRLERAAPTAADTANGYAGAITKIDLSRINLASVWQNRFEYRINYRLPLPAESWGRVNWSTAATNFNAHKTKARRSSPAINSVDTQNAPLRWRGNTNVSWDKGPYMAGLTVRYTNSYYASTTQPVPAIPTASYVDGRKIPASTTVDLQLGYRVAASQAERGWRKWASGTEWRLGILNVLDREPPFYSDSTGFYSRYDDPRQQFVYLQVKKAL